MFRKIIAFFLFSWSTLLFISSGIVESQDGLQYLTIARQIYYHQTFAMPTAKYPLDNIHMNTQLGRDGVEFSPTGLGYSVALLPAVAIEDVFNKLAGISYTDKFPLDNDWPIMLFGSMTNSFFGAVFIVTFYLFLKSFKYADAQSIFLSLFLFFSSNLVVYSKHSFAHMMFVTALWLSFFLLRKYRLTQKIRYLSAAAAAFGVLILSYNPTFMLTVPALGIYYLFSVPWKKLKTLKKKFFILFRDILIAIISVAPFTAVYLWFNWVRFGNGASTGYGSGSFVSVPVVTQAFVAYEGIWGLLFSPGKSVFLFTPVLLLLIIFWFKIRKEYIPEIVTGSLISVIYIYFIGTLVGGPDYFPWHGEASFGPRYLLPILPFGLLLVALLYRELTKLQKMYVFVPIASMGILIQLVGIVIPYQVRFSGFQYDLMLNGHRITYDTYANLIPRFSPLYTMSKWFIKKTLAIPEYYIFPPHVKFIDGIHGILPSSSGDLRQLEQHSALFLDKSVSTLPIQVPITNYTASSSANNAGYEIQIDANEKGQKIAGTSVASQSSSILEIPQTNSSIDRIIELTYRYIGTSSAQVANQYVFASNISAGGSKQELENYSYPYVSPVSNKLFGEKYYFWGNDNSKLWDLWNMRSIIYVHTYDLWWLRPYHYWDLPKNFYMILFLGNATICIGSAVFLKRLVEMKQKKTAKRK